MELGKDNQDQDPVYDLIPKAVVEAYRTQHIRNAAILTAQDPMCYPQLDHTKDPYRKPGETFAQALRSHIEFVLKYELSEAEDPNRICIY